MLNRFNCIFILVLCTLVFSGQGIRADVTGSVLGVVHDSSQAVVGGAGIVLTNTETNFKKETVSAADGSYRILALPAGTYTLTATAAGFQQFTAVNVDVKVNDELRVDIVLAVGGVKTEVNVAANDVQVRMPSTIICQFRGNSASQRS